MAAYLRRPILASTARMQASATLLLCLALLTGLAHPSHAQVVLQGRVLDDVSGLSLAGARVLLLNRYRKIVGHAITDEDGQFRFERRRPDMFRLEAKAIGYKETITPLEGLRRARYGEACTWLSPY